MRALRELRNTVAYLWVSGVVVSCILIPWAWTNIDQHHAHVDGTVVRISRMVDLPLPFMRPGTVLYLGVGADPHPPRWAVGCQQAGRIRRILGLNDLRGAVRITSPDAALEYARLLTCPATYESDLQIGFEIVSSSVVYHDNPDVAGQPAFHKSEVGGFHSGIEGVLSAKAYRAGAFTPATARATARGFEVDRWVYDPGYHPPQPHHPPVVEHLRELVGHDGSYRRDVLLEKQPPELPDTSWIGLRRR